ncbi:MAG: dienelactone hydrolase family protein, partial [Xanthomonadales bacterium]|nr:dienelactone hydrolase family protein [Xanthomonadales bacterium]
MTGNKLIVKPAIKSASQRALAGRSLALGLLALGLLQWPILSQAALQTEAVEYQADGITMKGWIAWDDSSKAQRPGVLVVHEWWGHNDYARRRAEDLAKLGYTALALDMYGDGKLAEHPDDAGKFASAVG